LSEKTPQIVEALKLPYAYMILTDVSISKLLVVLSGASYLIGTAFLAESIKWQSDSLLNYDQSELAKKVRQMGGPGRTDVFRLKVGLVFNALGYFLLLLSTAI
jgi:hypothetical protein